LLASVALCLATTILLKMQLRGTPAEAGTSSSPVGFRSSWVILVTLIPLVWLLSVTVSASLIKIFDASPRIGFIAAARAADAQRAGLEEHVASARGTGDEREVERVEKALRANRVTAFNSRVDAAVTAFFLVLVAGVVVLSSREWWLLLARRKPAHLGETEPVWLPDYAVTGARPSPLMGVAAVGCALLREITDEAQFERETAAKESGTACVCGNSAGARDAAAGDRQRQWVRLLDERYRDVRRCC
jgi:carbon starvation protein